jgi:AcrR family transcriptional regulator
LRDIVDAAAEVFREKGYRRAQMADIAAAAGVSPGTLYGYVEGKSALFHLVFEDAPLEGRALPILNPQRSETIELVRRRLAEAGALPVLRAALATPRATDARGELEAVIRERYEFQARNWRLFGLIERSAVDIPELRSLYFERGRRRITSGMARYLELRMDGGQMRRLHDPAMVSRIIEEAITWFAWHRRGDPDAGEIDDERASLALVETFTAALATGKRQAP